MTADNPDLRAPDFHGGLDWLLHSPGMEVQIYRRREDDAKRWEYLDVYLDDGNVRLEDLKGFEAGELDGIAPLERTRDAWGGGDYQFRFRWRDAQGRRTNVRSRDVSIAGPPVPRSGPTIMQLTPDRTPAFEQKGGERIRAAADREEVLTLMLIRSLVELRAEMQNQAPSAQRQASPVELATAMMTAVTSMTAPLLGALLADYAKPKPAPLDLEGMVRLLHSLKERSTDEAGLEAEQSSAQLYRRRRPLPLNPAKRKAGSLPDR